MSLTHLTLVRHGERADAIRTHPWNYIPTTRPKDPPLTSQGHLQARRAATHLAPQRANRIYVSPLTRCLQTAAEIARYLNLPVRIVYALAKPCAYFRRTLRAGLSPVHPDLNEARQIMKAVWANVVVEGFEGEDGTDCIQTLQRLAERESGEAEAEEIAEVVVVGHCESQVELARRVGIPYRMKTPFCGIAVFEIKRTGTSMDTQWKLIREPKVVDGEAPTQSGASSVVGYPLMG